MKFKAFIRVVKSLNQGDYLGFDSIDVIREPLIEAKDKNEVKSILLEKYPQFFQNNKIYEKSTKDEAQFFYVLIYPLYSHEEKLIEEGPWKCEYCNHIHENKYLSRPRYSEKHFGSSVLFCEEHCLNEFKKIKYANVEFPDNENYISKDSPIYIYKCTEKKTGKSYIGKTKNAPFFRWWNHLTHSDSPFGLYLRSTTLDSWTFEVLHILPYNMPEKEVFRIETEYIIKYDSINNGFNKVISNKIKLNKI